MANEITYMHIEDDKIRVSLNGKFVGNICKVEGGYKYYPRDSKIVGELFSTIQEVKDSIEEE